MCCGLGHFTFFYKKPNIFIKFANIMSNLLSNNWSRDTTKRFLKILGKLPAIWNEFHADYKNEAMRAKSFTVLVKLMNRPDLDEVAANRRFQSIRDSVLKHLRNIQHMNAAERAVELQKTFYPSVKYLVDMYAAKYKDGFRGMPRGPQESKLKIDWTVEHSRLLLSTVERYPVIWDDKHPKHFERKCRMAAFALVVEEMGLEGLEPELARVKYDNLRDTIYRKIRSKNKTGFTKSYYSAAQYLIAHYADKYPNRILMVSEDSIEWDTPHSSKLLTLIAEFPCLWNEEDKFYRTARVRAKAFQRVCASMNLPGYDEEKLHKKYASIRARVLKKFRMLYEGDATERAQAAKDLQLGFYPAAEFLIKYFRKKHHSNRTKTNVAGGTVKKEPPLKIQLIQPKITHSSCRICLSPSDGTFKSIIKADDESFQLQYDDIFQHTTNYIITTDQPFYPASLCERCEQELLASYVFKMKCERVEEFLQELYSCCSQQDADKVYENSGIVKQVCHEPKHEVGDKDTNKLHASRVIVKQVCDESKHEVMENYFYEDQLECKDVEFIDAKCVSNHIEHNYNKEEVKSENGSNQEEVLIPPTEIHSNDDEVEEEIDDGVLEQKITEQLQILDDCITLAVYRPPDELAPCEICGKVMNVKFLNGHVKSVHSTNTTRVQCDQCPAFLKDNRTLRSHKKFRHATVKRSYECRFCNHIANTVFSRRYHERTIHENGNKFKCTVCDKAFLTPARLKRHMLTHTDERNFACTMCPKRYKVKSQLDGHYTYSHTSAREVCPICHQQFMSKKTCRTHVQRVHDGNNGSIEQLGVEQEQDEESEQVQNEDDETDNDYEFEIE